jgi:hypothetical protein
MFADPTTVTIDGSGKALVRINQDGYSSEYLLRSTDDEYRLRIRNTSYLDRKRNVQIDRHNVELTHTIFPVAPATLSCVRKCYIVLENQQGDTLSDPVKEAAGLFAWLTASTNANLTKLVNFES